MQLVYSQQPQQPQQPQPTKVLPVVGQPKKASVKKRSVLWRKIKGLRKAVK